MNASQFTTAVKDESMTGEHRPTVLNDLPSCKRGINRVEAMTAQPAQIICYSEHDIIKVMPIDLNEES
uniref:Transcriptional regulator n=1 Tax=Panagrellus redivivus TaxID=6233 RepID=A0A7E4VX84_PANRE